MAAFESGVFPVHNNKFEVETSSGEWSEIANLEEFSVAINGVVETWQAMENGGWESALKTGASWSLSLKGKRTIGDPGNDFIANKRFAMGQDAYVNFRWTMPNGTTITQQMVVNVTADGSGDTTNVGALEVELQSNGKPEVGKAANSLAAYEPVKVASAKTTKTAEVTKNEA